MDSAIEHFSDSEGVRGNIDLVTTDKDDKLLITQSPGDTYFVGELAKDHEGYYTNRKSDASKMPRGGGWGVHTINNNEYTVYFEMKKKNQDYIQLSNKDYYISILEGNTITDNKDNDNKDTIKEIKTVKDDPN